MFRMPVLNGIQQNTHNSGSSHYMERIELPFSQYQKAPCENKSGNVIDSIPILRRRTLAEK